MEPAEDNYIPSKYPWNLHHWGETRETAALAREHFLLWEAMPVRESSKEDQLPELKPTICFARDIGVGALEVAERLSTDLGYRVADREIIDHIADDAQLSRRTVELFDERYPGRGAEMRALLFGERSFVSSDYIKTLARVVNSLALASPTIFVGRGCHRLLPRDKVLAVRFIAPREYRVKRLMQVMGLPEDKASVRLDDLDSEQRRFFKLVHGTNSGSSYDFDLTVNSANTPTLAAVNLVKQAFQDRFGS